jgi:mRNA-degrading endonuclease RelE of RelBE toxin-antitoxin system
VYTLSIHDNAKADLLSLQKTEPRVAAAIVTLLEEIEGSQALMGSLLDTGFGENRDEKFSVDKWNEYWYQNKDIWRLKAWSLEKAGLKYRVIYAYHVKDSSFHILAVAPRSFNYDTSSSLGKRIESDYNGL